MSRSTRDLLALLDRCVSSDDYGVDGSTFLRCGVCERESGAGLLLKQGWHAADCPVPRLEKKYAGRGQRGQR